MKVDNHSQRHWVPTEFINVAQVNQLNQFCILIPYFSLFLSCQQVRHVLFFFNQNRVRVWNVEYGFVSGFVLFAEILDIRVLFLCDFSDIFLSDNCQRYIQRRLDW